MPVKELSVPDQRLAFVLYRQEGHSHAAACRQFGISRPTGYVYLHRYEQEGIAGLSDHSRAPHRCPHAVSQDQRAKILELKAKYPTWGPKKIRARLEALVPNQAPPAASTIGTILKEAGLVTPNRRRPRSALAPRFPECEQANQLWCIDFKGQFLLGNNQLCFPLTLTDQASRLLIRCQALPDVSGAKVWPYMVGAFREHGLPEAIRSDNGMPFAASSATGLTRFSLNLLRLGIRLERIDPGCPQQNGAHERMHKTLKAEAVTPPERTLRAQQQRFDVWRHIYNQERPHEALAMKTPASAYTPSLRAFPERLPALEYPDGMAVYKVRSNGSFRWLTHDTYISEVLCGEHIGLASLNDRHHAVYVGHQALAILDEKTGRFLPAKQAQRLLAQREKPQ